MVRCVITILLLLISAPAFAWRQSSTCISPNDVDPLAPTAAKRCTGAERPFGFLWQKVGVGYQVSNQGSDDFADNAVLFDEIDTSFAQWTDVECSSFRFIDEGPGDHLGHQVDEINWVGFVEADWPHSSGAIAITTVTTERDGTIVDADMELNGQQNQFAIVDAQTIDDVYDVRNVVTHEAGHMLGLDHSAVLDSTMQFSSPPRQLKKRDLDDDDVEGLCTIYPIDFEPKTEPPPEDPGCCSTIGQDSRGTAAISVLFLLLVCVRRRGKR